MVTRKKGHLKEPVELPKSDYAIQKETLTGKPGRERVPDTDITIRFNPMPVVWKAKRDRDKVGSKAITHKPGDKPTKRKRS